MPPQLFLMWGLSPCLPSAGLNYGTNGWRHDLDHPVRTVGASPPARSPHAPTAHLIFSANQPLTRYLGKRPQGLYSLNFPGENASSRGRNSEFVRPPPGSGAMPKPFHRPGGACVTATGDSLPAHEARPAAARQGLIALRLKVLVSCNYPRRSALLWRSVARFTLWPDSPRS
jgi:hypothetical protein